MSRTIKQALLLGALLPFGLAAQAQEAGFVQLTYGSLKATNGYSDRDFIGLNSKFALSENTSLLFDLSRQDREENVTSIAVGAEFNAGPGALRFIVEGSNSDLGTAPDRKYTLGYRYTGDPSTGMVYDFEISRAEYAGNIDATTLRGELIKYYPEGANGSFLVTQLSASVTEPSGAADMGYDVAGVATLVAGNLNVGAELGFGKITYDLAPLAPVNNDYTAFKPFVSYRFGGNAEVILRGEFVDTDLYDLEGASLGIKLGL
ncbi:MAG: hypothetical protein ACK47C_02915 [Paracoccaceae bacterium]